MVNTDPFFGRGPTNHSLKKARVLGVGGRAVFYSFLGIPLGVPTTSKAMGVQMGVAQNELGQAAGFSLWFH